MPVASCAGELAVPIAAIARRLRSPMYESMDQRGACLSWGDGSQAAARVHSRYALCIRRISTRQHCMAVGALFVCVLSGPLARCLRDSSPRPPHERVCSPHPRNPHVPPVLALCSCGAVVRGLRWAETAWPGCSFPPAVLAASTSPVDSVGVGGDGRALAPGGGFSGRNRSAVGAGQHHGQLDCGRCCARRPSQAFVEQNHSI